MNRLKAILFTLLLTLFCLNLFAQDKATLQLETSIPLPDLKDGDFDHFAVDLDGHRLFSTAEENEKVLVIDTNANKLIHTIDDLKAPHSMLFRGDLKKLFVVDGDLGEVKIYETTSYKPVGSIKVREGADSSGYDPKTKYLYVVDGGGDAHLPNAYIAIIDTDAAKQIAEIKMDSDDVEAMAFEKSGPRVFVDNRANATVEVLDRNQRKVTATWSIADVAKKPTTIAFDEANHRLLVGTRAPGKLVILDSDSGKVTNNIDAPATVDDMPYDAEHKRLYYSGTDYTDVFQQHDPDHYDRIGHIATASRAKTAILIPEWGKYYLSVPRHENQGAEIRVYKVVE